jgi:paired small multidrug resistance pump
MSWVYLIIAGIFEMLAVLMMNEVNKRKSWQSVAIMIAAFGSSFLFLALAMAKIQMGVAYAIWTGIGASGGAIIGMLFYNESNDWRRIISIFLIIGAVVGLKLVS